MAIKEFVTYRCICDKCGRILSRQSLGGDCIDFHNMKELINKLAFSGWKIIEIHNTDRKVLLCRSCANSGNLIRWEYFNKNIILT